MIKNENTTEKTGFSNKGLHHNGLHYLREKEKIRKKEGRLK